LATEIVMPQMGYDMTEGTIAKWIKKEGDQVKRGEIIAEIETDKATIEMEADASGILRKIIVPEGVKVPVHEAIAFIGTADEVIPENKGQEADSRPIPAAQTDSDEPIGVESQSQSIGGHDGQDVRVSPIARRLASENGIDIQKVPGTGPGGRITKEDILGFIEQSDKPSPDSNKTSGNRLPLSNMGQAIARRTQQAKQEIPHYYVSVSIDMTRALEFRAKLNHSGAPEEKVSVNDLIIKACSLALADYPMFNSIFAGDHLQVSSAINIGVAISLDEGLIVPAILNCEDKSLHDIARATKSLGERARSGRLGQAEYTAGTFSISNLGMYQIDSFAAIIVAPQSAVLAVGTVKPQPAVTADKIVIKNIMQATLSADHRVSNGTDSALFITKIRQLLENPDSLI